MSKKNRNYKKSHGGLSPYMQWVLVGLILDYHVIPIKRGKKFFQLVDKHGVEKTKIHANAIRSLTREGFLEIPNKGEQIRVTTAGFDKAHDRIKLSLNKQTV
jgi:hypothetical protein